MSNFLKNAKRRKIHGLLLLVLIIGIYLNRSYAYIYEKIDDVGYLSSIMQEEYVIANSATDNTKYVAIGDSLTAGVGIESYTDSYPYILAQKISEKTKTNVILKPIAIPGIRTGDISKTLLNSIIESNPSVITVFSGVNDVYGNVSKKVFEEYYRDLIQNLITRTDAKIYLINIPYIGDASLILPPYNYYFDYRTKQLNKIIKNIAEENNLTYVDLYSDAKIFSKNEDYYSLDMFHPSESGYLRWANSIYENFYK